ncbi:helix-turn-helix domain-containing protein [Swaminathania salitolerans]|uniref:Transcriptional regulator n=1 Tax=Swaminathania salitolerans TaxID=182838 RepID=A0A511BQM8_9PROT|nr:helix-turn-helix domain-containing protein [Swaminathania salitolerans]GBQ11859.1 transcriptional regulator [Swaminathania salitolerans LMG 21291]GEL02646.1 transcriptional regulator [Swaminathania salitolerans]
MNSVAKSASAAGPIDAHVGARIRLRRTLLGMSQEKLGAALGLTFQQVQKYERGTNKVGASRLYELSRVLDVPIGFFFDDIAGRAGARVGGQPTGFAEIVPSFGLLKPSGSKHDLYDPEAQLDDDTLELLRAYRSIEDPRIKRQILDLVRTLSGAA